MPTTIIRIPQNRNLGKARGKQPTSSSIKAEQGSTPSIIPLDRSNSTPLQLPASPHMEVAIKLTWEMTNDI